MNGTQFNGVRSLHSSSQLSSDSAHSTPYQPAGVGTSRIAKEVNAAKKRIARLALLWVETPLVPDKEDASRQAVAVRLDRS